MVALVSVLVIALLSMLITRVATVALALTGMSRESARFQARSAYLGVGFTTAEAESVVNHPVRRRIISALIFTGNAGVVTVVATLFIGFGAHSSGALAGKLGIAAGAVVLIG